MMIEYGGSRSRGLFDVLNLIPEPIMRNIFRAEVGNLEDASNKIRLQGVIETATQRVLLGGKIDDDLVSIAGLMSQSVDVKSLDDIEARGPFIIIDNDFVAFEKSRFVRLSNCPEIFLRHFVKMFN